MNYQRPQLQILKSRIASPRRFIQALTGPRQVGKTTIVKQLLQETQTPSLYLAADSVAYASNIWIEQQWEAVRLKYKISGFNEFLLIIDEIQKISNWSEIVKAMWDYDSFNNLNIKLILLGSSGLVLQKGLNESLAGRYELIKVPHWSFAEMNSCFGFSAEQYAWFGGYPGSANLISDEYRWKDYIKNAFIDSIINKDIIMLNRVDKPALMRQVFELGVHYSSQILSITKMMGSLQDSGNSTTISHYVKLLDSAGLLTGIQKYYKEKHREKASIPKWQVKNTAFVSSLSSSTFDEIQKVKAAWGRIIESAVGAHLINCSLSGTYEVYYWRHRNKEVDFVLQKQDKLIGIEVKSGKTKPTQGMKEFKMKYNPEKVLLVGTEGLHWADFLKVDPAELF